MSGCHLLVIAIVFLWLQGCAPKVQVSYIPQQKRSLGTEKPLAGKENVLVLKRHYEKWRGTPYIDGGMSASGIDCSGFTVLAYRDLFGVALPRTAGEQAESGREVARASLRTGDLVFFNTMRNAFSHVGIYLGDNQFVHAPRSGGRVRVEDLRDGYWTKRFNGARRVKLD